MEIPVQHEASQQRQQQNQNWPQQPTMQYPQSKSPPRVATPPRVGTPPRNQTQTPPKFFTLPRNHRERTAPGPAESVREIPIQHFSSKAGQQGHQPQTEMNYPQPDYPGAPGSNQQMPQSQQFGNQPAPNQGHAYPNFSQRYPHPPQQGYQYPSSTQFGPQGQAPYPQYTAPQPHPSVHPASQGHQGPPMPQPMMQQEHSSGPSTPQQCAPPMQEQHVEYNIPIIREQPPQAAPQISQAQAGFQTWPRQPKPQKEQGFTGPQPKVTATAERTSTPDHSSREQTPGGAPMDQTDHGAQQPQPNTQQVPKPNGQNGQQEQKTAKTPLDMINSILSGCQQYKDRVNGFCGGKTTKEYKFLEEMLTRSLLKLDGIESGQDLSIRQARRAAVKEIQSYLDQLELKAFSEAAPVSQGNGARSDNSETSHEQMDTSSQKGDSAVQKDDRAVKEMVLDSEVSC